MGKSMRGEQPSGSEISVADQNARIKTVTRGIAAKIISEGGPHNRLEEGLVDLAEVAGNAPEEVRAATEALIKPKFTQKPPQPSSL